MPQEDQLIIIRELRDISRNWLQGIRDSIIQNEGINISLQPFSRLRVLPGSPFSNSSIFEQFRWVTLNGDNEIYNTYNVSFEFHSLQNAPWSPAVWSLSSNSVALGFIELDGRIFHDQNSFLHINDDFILTMMITSLSENAHLRISSRIETLPVHNPFGANQNIEYFEVQTIEGRVVHQLGCRVVPQRVCGTCLRWIPPGGPTWCIDGLCGHH